MALKFTICVDAREKRALPFPETVVTLDRSGRNVTAFLRVRKLTLPEADYVLADGDGVFYTAEGSRQAAAVERKWSIHELQENLFTPHRRINFLSALDRLTSTYRFPCLVLDGGLDALKSSPRCPVAGPVIDSFIDALYQRGISFWGLAPSRSENQRRLAGDFVARMLIRGVMRHGLD